MVIQINMKSFFLIIPFCILLTLKSYACDCDGEEISVEAAFKESEIILIGTVISFEDLKNDKTENDFWIIKFEISEVFKGEFNQTTIDIVAESTDCGGDFLIGNSYLVYSFMNKELEMNEYHQCFKSAKQMGEANKDIERLRLLRKN